MRILRETIVLFLLPVFTFSYDTIQIWTRGGGGWIMRSCNTTFVHFEPLQDVRLSELLDADCYCTIFDRGLIPDDLAGMEVKYTYYTDPIWMFWHLSTYGEWANTSHRYPRFKVQSNQTVVIPMQSGDVTRDLQTKINIQIENGLASLLCSPDGYIDPTTAVTTTIIPTTVTEVLSSSTYDVTTTRDTMTSPKKADSKSPKSEDSNSLYYVIIGVVAGAIVLILIVIIIVVALRKSKPVDKQSGGLIGHIMRQRSTISQAQSLYSHHTWKDAPPAGLDTVVYDYDGILAPDSSRTDHNKQQSSKKSVTIGDINHRDPYTEKDGSDSGTGDTLSQDTGSSRMLVCHM